MAIRCGIARVFNIPLVAAAARYIGDPDSLGSQLVNDTNAWWINRSGRRIIPSKKNQ